MGSKETMLEIRLILPEVRGAVCSLETTTMKRRFLAVIVAVVMIATGAEAETRVYQGTLEPMGASREADSFGGTLIRAYPSQNTRILVGLRLEKGRFSLRDLRLNGKRSNSKYFCRRVANDSDFARVAFCTSKTREKDELFEGKVCTRTQELRIFDDAYLSSLRPLIVAVSYLKCPAPDYWILRGWYNYVKRIR